MKITQDDIAFAYTQLPPEDRERIDKQARILEMRIREKRTSNGQMTKAYFGKIQALELLWKLGRWMNEEGM